MTKEPQGDAKGHPPTASRPSDPKPPVEPREHEPEEHRIRDRAYEIWVEEGKPDGRDQEHWLRARWELRREVQPK